MPRRSSAAVIRSRIRALEKQALRLERGSTKGLRAAAAVIAKHGLSMADLRKAFAMGKGRGKSSALAGKAVAPKYRDADGNTWTGRGRSPLWLVAAEKAGKKRESFLIDAKKAKPKAAKPKKSTSGKSSTKKPASKPTSESPAA